MGRDSLFDYIHDADDQEQKKMIMDYGSRISETLMTTRVNIDKKKELMHLKTLQCFVDYYARMLKIADDYDIHALRDIIDRETRQKNNSYTRNPITDQEIRYLIKLNIIQSISAKTLDGLDDVHEYFARKYEKNVVSIVIDKFRKYRAIQCNLLEKNIGFLLDEINHLKEIVSGKHEPGDALLDKEMDQLKILIDKLHGKISNKETAHFSEHVG